jgi:hypothetical protein
MNIAQVSQLSGRGAGFLSIMLQNSPLLRFADFRLDYSTYFAVPDKSTHTGSSARAVNAALQRDAQSPNPTAAALALYGREISIDDLYKMDQRLSGAPDGLRLFMDRQLSSLAVKLADEVSTDMLAGPGTANRMVGLSEFVKDAPAGGQTARLGFTADEIAAMNTQVGLQLNSADAQNAFLETLEKELAKVPGANAILCNVNLGARMSTIAKRIGAAGVTTDSFGQPVETYNGVPIVRLQTSAIPQTESDGTNTDCTSLYIVRFEENLGVTYSTNSGFLFTDFPDGEVKPNAIARLQFFLNLTVNKANALRRLSRIRL